MVFALEEMTVKAPNDFLHKSLIILFFHLLHPNISSLYKDYKVF